jgi:ligand-binding sensor domain-containing protein
LGVIISKNVKFSVIYLIVISKLMTFNYRIVFLLISLLAWIRPVFPQYQDLKFERYSVLDGLSQGWIQSIQQDHKGFMWFGTNNGLNRFDGHSFKNYLSDGDDPTSLNANRISALFEDSKGRLWIGCGSEGGGLHIYDRNKDNFIRILPDKEIPLDPGGNNVRKIAQDTSGNLWLGTNSGVLMFNPDSGKKDFLQFNNEPKFPSNISSGIIDALFVDSKNKTWIGTAAGLYLFDPEKNSFDHFEHSSKDPNSLGDNRVQDIIEDNNGTLWIGTRDGGLNRLIWSDTVSMDPVNIRFIRYLHDPSDPGSISSNVINALSIDESGTLWIGTEEGIDHIMAETLPIGMDGSSIQVKFINYQTNALNNESLNYNIIRSIYFDASGILWVGTNTGLNKQKNYKFSHFKQDITENSLASNKIQAFCEDDQDIIWVGTSKGLNQFNRKNNTCKFIMSGAIMSISQDQQGLLWIGQWHNGLIKYNPTAKQVINYKHSSTDPTSIGADHSFTTYVDNENNVWICTWRGGLNLYNRENDSFIRFRANPDSSNSLSSDHLTAFFEDSKGNLWIGTLNGLNLLKNKEKGTFVSYLHDPSDNSSISHNFINCIFETRDGTLWIGTQEGLNKMNMQDNSFVTYTRSNGLPDDAIMGMLEDDLGNLWISTANGMLKIIFSKIEEHEELSNSDGELSIITSSVLNDPDRLLVKRFDVDDGLQSREFVARASLKARSGEMFFGGINGFNVFHPDSIKDNIHPPKVALTAFQLFNKEVSLGEVFNGDTILRQAITEAEEITLSHKNNIFSIEFAALHFVAPDQNKYAYMLEGFEYQWNFVDNDRKASYTNLDHGEYLFKVKASNNDGIWNDDETSLRIIITPPFWKTWWFKILVIVIVIVSALAVIEIRLYAIKHQKKVLEIKVKSRTEQVVQQRDQIQAQSFRINQMNEVLKKHNIELEDDVHHLSEARVMQKLIGFDEFKTIYQDETACCMFLEELKWNNGYICKKCGSHEFCKDDNTLMRRCKKCNYKESVTCGTIFHRLRFPIDKAFYILILTSTGREINISQLSNTIDLRMKTCWEFHNKVKGIMQTRKRFKNPKEGWKEMILLPKKSVTTSK